MRSVRLCRFDFRSVSGKPGRPTRVVHIDALTYREGDDTLAGRKLGLLERLAVLFGANVAVLLRGHR